MVLIYCYRWSCYSWREINKSQSTVYALCIRCVSVHPWSQCESDVNAEINNEESFCFHKLFRSRFDSVQWSWHSIFSHHCVACNYLFAQTKRVTSDALCWRKQQKLAIPILFSFCLRMPLSVANIVLNWCILCWLPFFFACFIVAWCRRFYFFVCCMLFFLFFSFV